MGISTRPFVRDCHSVCKLCQTIMIRLGCSSVDRANLQVINWRDLVDLIRETEPDVQALYDVIDPCCV